MTTPVFTPAQIRRYYDRNTAAFVRLGQGAGAGAIHRAVWGPEVANREQAFHYVEDRIADLVAGLVVDVVASRQPRSTPPHIVDLGCGVGASLTYLAGRLPVTGTGVTLSPVQARVATERVAAAGLAGRVVCLEGDYCALPPRIVPPAGAAADLAYAIESFVHGPSPARFFAEAARVVRPGGLLVICDDMRRPSPGMAAARAVARFQRGWHVNALLTAEELRGLAAAAGFSHESTTDLTPHLELHRLRDRAIAVLVMLTAWLPVRITRLEPLVGGSALQTCLARGWIGYDFTVFRRTAG